MRLKLFLLGLIVGILAWLTPWPDNWFGVLKAASGVVSLLAILLASFETYDWDRPIWKITYFNFGYILVLVIGFCVNMNQYHNSKEYLERKAAAEAEEKRAIETKTLLQPDGDGEFFTLKASSKPEEIAAGISAFRVDDLVNKTSSVVFVGTAQVATCGIEEGKMVRVGFRGIRASPPPFWTAEVGTSAMVKFPVALCE